MTRVSISEARKRLPQLVRQVKQDRGSVVQITVRDEVVAELRAALPEPEPGAAALAKRHGAGLKGCPARVSLKLRDGLWSSHGPDHLLPARKCLRGDVGDCARVP